MNDVRTIKVLVVDDSTLMRNMVGDIIKATPGLKLIGSAKNGLEAIELVKQLSPDVVTMDIEMPKMDGLQALARLMSESPVATVMLSAHAKEGAESTLLALELGAVDFVTKPSGSISLDIDKVRDELVEKIRIAADVDLAMMKPGNGHHSAPMLTEARIVTGSSKLLAIGSSTGGTRALSEILPKLPKGINASLLLVQHMPVGFTKSLAERLDNRSKIRIKEAEDGDLVERGVALLAPAGYHMELSPSGDRVKLNQNPPKFGVRPSVDVMMESVAQYSSSETVGVILTGMGHDGANGVASMKKKGGHIIAEDRSTCVVYGMPKAAVETGAVDEVLPLGQIPGAIVKACH
jgi:two-component system chemotaxis response regulator CheB